METLRRIFQVTPDYCRGILEAETQFRVFVFACAAALVATLGLSAGRNSMKWKSRRREVP